MDNRRNRFFSLALIGAFASIALTGCIVVPADDYDDDDDDRNYSQRYEREDDDDD